MQGYLLTAVDISRRVSSVLLEDSMVFNTSFPLFLLFCMLPIKKFILFVSLNTIINHIRPALKTKSDFASVRVTVEFRVAGVKLAERLNKNLTFSENVHGDTVRTALPHGQLREDGVYCPNDDLDVLCTDQSLHQ